MPRTNSKVAIAELQALATGLPKFFPSFAFLFASQKYTTTDMVTAVNAALASLVAITAAESAARAARLANVKVQSQYGEVIKEVRQFISLAFSNDAATLAALGMTPKKVRTPMTAAQKAVARAKAEATRKARGTTSKKQKALIHGDVTGVEIIPVTASATGVTPTPPSPSVTVTGTTATGLVPGVGVTVPGTTGH